jgi:hypothetical protein
VLGNSEQFTGNFDVLFLKIPIFRAIDEHDQELAVKCISDTNDQATNMSMLNEIEILKAGSFT